MARAGRGGDGLPHEGLRRVSAPGQEGACRIPGHVIAAEYRIVGNASVGRGWLGRARRLLDGVPECSSHGWLEVELSKRSQDPDEEERHARSAVEIARRVEDSDLEVTALSHVGLARISQGEVEDGLSYLDEAMAAATGGEAEDPIAIGEACCITLVACEQLAAAQRARDWGHAVVDFTRRRNYTPLAAWCRTIYAGFLIASGRWGEAERELERSLREYGRLGNPRFAVLPVGRSVLQGRAPIFGGFP